MKKKYYKVYELVVVEVLSDPRPERFDGTSYHVKRSGTDKTGYLLCRRPLSIGDEVFCNVGDSDENGDNMILIIHDHDICASYENRKISEEELESLNDEADLRHNAFREDLDKRREMRAKEAG